MVAAIATNSKRHTFRVILLRLLLAFRLARLFSIFVDFCTLFSLTFTCRGHTGILNSDRHDFSLHRVLKSGSANAHRESGGGIYRQSNSFCFSHLRRYSSIIARLSTSLSSITLRYSGIICLHTIFTISDSRGSRVITARRYTPNSEGLSFRFCPVSLVVNLRAGPPDCTLAQIYFKAIA